MELEKKIIIKALEDLQLHNRLGGRFKQGTIACNLYIFAQKYHLIDIGNYPLALLSLWKEGKIAIDCILYDDQVFEEINSEEVVDFYRKEIEGNFSNDYPSRHISLNK